MKVLIAAPTCPQHAELTQACRETWGSTTLCDVKFYSAADMNVPAEASSFKTDETPYCIRPGENLSYRVRELCRWALEQGYDFIFKCDTDTFIFPDRLLASDFEHHDYTGFAHLWHTPVFASGGSGFWLSRKAMTIIAAQEIADDPHDDVWVGEVLHKNGIALHDDRRYHPTLVAPDQNTITVHYVKDPATMRRLYALAATIPETVERLL